MLKPGLSPKHVLTPTQIHALRNSADLWKILASYFSNPCAIEDNSLQASWNQNMEGQQYCESQLQTIATHSLRTSWMQVLSLFSSSLHLFKNIYF